MEQTDGGFCTLLVVIAILMSGLDFLGKALYIFSVTSLTSQAIPLCFLECQVY